MTDSRERLDHYLVRLGFARSRRAAREMLEGCMVRLNGRTGRKGDLVVANDAVEVIKTPAPLALLPDPEVNVEILFQDEAVVVVNKRAPMPCHPLRPDETGTVMNSVVALFPEIASIGDDPREGGLVHRLDNGTSGALLIARTSKAFHEMRAAIRSGAVRRKYLALVLGNLKESLQLNTPLAHHLRNARKMVAVVDTAKTRFNTRPAATAVEPIRADGRFTLAAVIPQTGLRHQIRVHLAQAGYPIAGDVLYGGPSIAPLPGDRFWLHLAEIEFCSPASGAVRVRSPLPPDLELAQEHARGLRARG
jgi:23S rRNA pseudouridine1911/1915/1917 synthase